MTVRRWVLLAGAAALVVAAGVAMAMALADKGDPGQAVDYAGLRIVVPDDFHVQDIEGKLDGELSCPPDAAGFVFTGEAGGGTYMATTCDVDGEETIVRLRRRDPRHSPIPLRDWGPIHELNGLRYQLVNGSVRPGQVEFLDPPVSLHVVAPDRENLLRRLVRGARRSPKEGLAVPTTAPATSEVRDRLASQLGCARIEKAATYARTGSPIVGRQKEAPVDCHADGFGYRILVFRDPVGRAGAEEYYDAVWLVLGPDWAITAMSEAAARHAHDRVGGRLREPVGCCGPPTSDFLPFDDP